MPLMRKETGSTCSCVCIWCNSSISYGLKCLFALPPSSAPTAFACIFHSCTFTSHLTVVSWFTIQLMTVVHYCLTATVSFLYPSSVALSLEAKLQMLHTYMTVTWLPLPCEVKIKVHTFIPSDVCFSTTGD